MSTPDVTIIMPCYNAAETLTATVESVRAQTGIDWQLVSVNDASTDETPALLDSLAAEDRRIQVMHVSHGGLAASRNRGLMLARAPYVLFLDADDLLQPNALAALRAAAEAAPGALIAGGVEWLAADGTPLGERTFPVASAFTVDALLRGNAFTCSMLVPRDLLGGQPFDQQLPVCEDWDLWLRLASRGATCVTVPQVVLGYRLRADSLAHRSHVMFRTGRQVIERWLPAAHDPQRVQDARHRWAVACGALAFAAGDGAALHGYLSALPPLRPRGDFVVAAANAVRRGFLFARGAAGETWATRRGSWLAELEPWLRHGSLKQLVVPLIERITDITRSDPGVPQLVRRWLAEHEWLRHVVFYGLGNNGVQLLSAWRAEPPASVRLSGADDAAADDWFAQLGLERSDPHAWSDWPPETGVIVTPNDSAAIVQRLRQAGGVAGRDFVVLTPSGSRQAAEAVGAPARGVSEHA